MHLSFLHNCASKHWKKLQNILAPNQNFYLALLRPLVIVRNNSLFQKMISPPKLRPYCILSSQFCLTCPSKTPSSSLDTWLLSSFLLELTENRRASVTLRSSCRARHFCGRKSTTTGYCFPCFWRTGASPSFEKTYSQKRRWWIYRTYHHCIFAVELIGDNLLFYVDILACALAF